MKLGSATPTVAAFVPQNLSQFPRFQFGQIIAPNQQATPTAAIVSLPTQDKRIVSGLQIIKGGRQVKTIKVCEVCGMMFDSSDRVAYMQHISWHCALLQHPDPTVKTKEAAVQNVVSQSKFRMRCNICHQLFTSPISYRLHKRKIHSLFECKHCLSDFSSHEKWVEHLLKVHNIRTRKRAADPENKDKPKPEPPQETPDLPPSTSEKNEAEKKPAEKKQLTCHLCNKAVRNRYQLKIHVAQHLGVSSDKIIDVNLIDANSSSFKPQASSSAIDKDSTATGTSSAVSEPAQPNPIALPTEGSSFRVPTPILPKVIEIKAKSVEVAPSPTIESQDSNPAVDETASTSREVVVIKDEPVEVLDVCSTDTSVTPQMVRIRRRRPKPPRPRRPLIPCNHCPMFFTTRTAQRIHVKRRHTKKPQCPLCFLTKSNMTKLKQHQAKVHKDKLRCKYSCGALLDTVEQRTTHHWDMHKKDDTKLRCRYCRKTYARGAYDKHLEECDEDPIARKVCYACDASFNSLKLYQNHVLGCTYNKLDPGKNMTLEDLTSSREDMTEVLEAPDDEAQFSDALTRRESTDSMLVSTPIEAGAPNKRFKRSDSGSEGVELRHKCKFCTSTFKNSEDGIDHILMHHKTYLSNKNLHLCQHCNKSFVSGISFCKHLIEHYGDQGLWDSLVPADLDMENVQVECWICKSSGLKYQRNHITMRDTAIDKYFSGDDKNLIGVAEGETFNCSVCEESFPSRYAYWSHIKVHLSKSSFKNAKGGKRFNCSKCSLKFKKKWDLLWHLATYLLVSNSRTCGKKRVADGSNEDTVNDDKKCVADKDTVNDVNQTEDGENAKEIAKEDGKEDAKENPSKLYKCKRCKEAFDVKDDGLHHIVTTHRLALREMMDSETHSCHLCDKKFFKSIMLCTHVLKHYTELNMWDDLVPRSLLTTSQDRRYCWICKNVLGKKGGKHVNLRNNYIEKVLLDNKEDLEDKDSFLCSLCDYVCTNRYSFWKHSKLHMYKYPKSPTKSPAKSDKDDSFECTGCLLKFEDRSELDKHVASHFLIPYTKNNVRSSNTEELDPKPRRPRTRNRTKRLAKVSSNIKLKGIFMRCIRCAETFTSIDQAIEHVLASHKFMQTRIVKEPFMCHICGTSLKSPWCLCRHIAKHYSTLEMWDALVPRDLVNQPNIRNQCWICHSMLDKKYANHVSKRSFFVEHLLKKSCFVEEDEFHCSACKETYPTRVEYWKHMKIHLCKPPIQYRSLNELLVTSQPRGEAPQKILECSDCTLIFPDEPQLYKHLATHFLEDVEDGRGNTVDEVTTDESDSGSSEDEWKPSSWRATRQERRMRTRVMVEEGVTQVMSKEPGEVSNGDSGDVSNNDVDYEAEETETADETSGGEEGKQV